MIHRTQRGPAARGNKADGRSGIERIAYREIAARDIYHGLLTMSWPSFFALLALAYTVFNLLYALLYLAGGDGIANAHPGSFADAFFFSVQTMATIGYGHMHPQTLYANLLVAVEALMGMTGLALATGLIFARFSRRTARVMFSRFAVIAPHDGVPTLMFRAANQRRSLILEAQVSVSLLRDERTAEGESMRRFHDLALVRRNTPMFALSWTVMHPIDERSPLHGATPESLRAEHAEIVVGLIGLDEAFAQTVHARHFYGGEEILRNKRLADILERTADGRRVIDYRRFHELRDVEP